MNKNTTILFDKERYYADLKASVEAAKESRHNAIAKGYIKPEQEAKKVDFGLIINNIPMDPHKNLIINFSRPTINKIKNSYQLFTNVYFCKYDILEIDSNSLIERSRNILGYQTTFLIIVYPEYGETKSDFIFSHSIPNCQIQVIHTSFLGLFSKGDNGESHSLFDKIYLQNNNSSLALRTLFNFRGWTYSQLVSFFRNYNIILSGGAKSRNHILNPSSHRFSQFISILEGYNMKGIIESFNLPNDLYETKGIERAMVGPKLVKDKHTIGNISTKEYDNKFRALMHEAFNSEVPNSRKITNQNNSNQTTISENTNVSHISINIPSTNDLKKYDFKNDALIDSSLIAKVLPESEAKEYLSKIEIEKQKIIDNLRASQSKSIMEKHVKLPVSTKNSKKSDNSNVSLNNSLQVEVIKPAKIKYSISNVPYSKVAHRNIKKYNKIQERLSNSPKSKSKKVIYNKISVPNSRTWVIDGAKIKLPSYLRPQPASDIPLVEREAVNAERLAKLEESMKDIREINEARDAAKALKLEQDKIERHERKLLMKEIQNNRSLKRSGRIIKENLKNKKPGDKRK